MVRGQRGRICTAILVATLTLLTACGSSSNSRDRNAITLMGQSCKKPGAIKRSGGLSYVCGHIRRAKPKQGIYYGVAAVKNWKCVKLGTTRYQNGIFSVCSGGANAKKRKWALTVPIPVALGVIVDKEESTSNGALEASGVSIPDGFVALPKTLPTLVAASTTTSESSSNSTSPTSAVVSTTALTEETTLPGSPTTAVQQNALEPSTTLVNTASTTSTSVAGASTTAPADTIAPVAGTTTTTTQPDTHQTPTTAVRPNTTTTTDEPTTVATTVPAPTTEAPTTVVTTTPPAVVVNKTCAQGGSCAPGDVGPGGGNVVVVNPTTLIEVAPVTWYVRGESSELVAARLTFGGKSDWRTPSSAEMIVIRASRGPFRCPRSKRCALGFANAQYWATSETGPKTVDFAGAGPAEDASIKSSHYIRPVRSLVGVQLNTTLGPS